MPILIDDFMPDPEAVRAHALASPFVDWEAPDGETYRRVARVEVPGLHQRIVETIGKPIDMLGMGYRLNFAGELPNAAVHSDLGWGTHAAVVYLTLPQHCAGGTAFWSHRATGAHRIDPGDAELFERVRDDWNRREAWRLEAVADMRFNRAVIYESALFHSRWPFEAFGSGPEDGRLIAVAFFTPWSEPK